MWALQKSSVHLRNHKLLSGHAQIYCGKLGTTKRFSENSSATSVGPLENNQNITAGLVPTTRIYNTSCSPSKLYREICTFSSQVGVNRGGEDDDDMEDGFSEFDEESVSGDTHNELDAVSIETNVGENEPTRSWTISSMKQAILGTSGLLVGTILDKWIDEGNKVTRMEMTNTLHILRKQGMFFKALQLLEWAKSAKHLEFIQSDYVSHLDLIAKVQGIYKAEEYLNQIPESFRGETVYCTLLANCVSATNVKKSEEIFNTMKILGFPITNFSCNQLLLLYKRTDKKKIVDVLQLMQDNSIKPSLFTFKILIDVKGTSQDITGLEKIIEAMKLGGYEPNHQIQASLAQYYVVSGLKDKAEGVLKQMEGSDITTNHKLRCVLLPLYASIGREDEVDRIWKVCGSNPLLTESTAAIEAWGLLNKIEKAEAVFEHILQIVKRPSSRHYTVLLNVYANHKMLDKVKNLVKRMEEDGCTMEPLILDSIVRLYIGFGEVEKADSIMEKATNQKLGRPFRNSYMAIMDQYARRGDVHNAEKIFHILKEAGFAGQHRAYELLLEAYINGGLEAYGFIDRMKADGVYPNRTLSKLLGRAAKIFVVNCSITTT